MVKKKHINYHGTLAFPGLPSKTFTQDDVHTCVDGKKWGTVKTNSMTFQVGSPKRAAEL